MSDFHLGSYNCKAKRLYEFLWRNEAEKIYLVGDILEGNVLSRWPPYHDDVLRLLAERSRAGTEIIFIPGNHDAVFRHHFGVYAGLTITHFSVHECVNGTRLFVTHGDDVDFFRGDFLLWCIVKLERLTGWHLWEMLRRWFKQTIASHTETFENKMIVRAHDHGFLGVVCGHIHMPKIVDRGALYMNSGDWVHHCTAIAEDDEGNFHILRG
jgi:UDP-2,3-diacylglucosamine pyrophosphatase LpxH